MQEIGIHYTKQNLSEILRRVQAGEAFIITNRGEEVAVLTPAEAKRRERSKKAFSTLTALLKEQPLADDMEDFLAMRDAGKK